MRFGHSEPPAPIWAPGLLMGSEGGRACKYDSTGHGQDLLETGEILIAAVGYAIAPIVIKHSRLFVTACPIPIADHIT